MKVCTKCFKVLPFDMYFVRDKKVNRLHAQCKSCYKEHRKQYSAEHYRKYGDLYRLRAKKRKQDLRSEFQNNMINYMKDKQCVLCKETDPIVLEFDHIDNNDKLFSISQSVSKGYSWKEALDEMKKCQILCANCHKRKTAKQFNWYKQ